ncbi:MAG: Ca-activated chloride channel family protein [Lysobacterales bacterium]|jgi:Ca-activated chloride channel family protein
MYINQTQRIILIILGVFFLSGELLLSEASVFSKVNKGNNAYENKDYDEAYKEYIDVVESDGELGIISYNLGNVQYQRKKYDEAIEYYQKSLLTDDDVLQFKVKYNLANTLFYNGLLKEQDDVDEAIENLEEALRHYSDLRSIKENESVEYNYPMVERELQRLKQEKQKQESQQNQEGEGDQSDEKDNSEKSDEQNQNKAGNEEQNKNNGQEKSDSDNENEQQQDSQDKDSPEGDEESKSQSEKDDDKAEDEGEQSSSKEQSDSKDSKGQSSTRQVVNPQELTKQEAQMLLDDYEQNKAPKGMLKFIDKTRERQSTYQDW